MLFQSPRLPESHNNMASGTAGLNFTSITFTVSRKTGRLDKNYPGMEIQQRRVTQANLVSGGSDHGGGGPGQRHLLSILN